MTRGKDDTNAPGANGQHAGRRCQSSGSSHRVRSFRNIACCRESRQIVERAIKFLMTGATSTAIYVGLSYVMIATRACGVVVSSVVAFITASLFSYLANTLWSFSETPTTANLAKFAAVAISGSIISATILKCAIAEGFGYWIGITLTLCFVPLMTFIAHQFWTYRQEPLGRRMIVQMRADRTHR